MIKQYTSLSLGNLHSILLQASEKLLSVNFPVAIIGVEAAEAPAQSSNGGSSSLCQLLSQSVQNYNSQVRLHSFLLISTPQLRRDLKNLF